MTAKHPALRLVRAVDPAPAPVREAAPGRSDAYRVEVWVGGGGAGRPWLASSAIVGSMAEARTHATQSVSGLVTDGIDPGSVFVGAIHSGRRSPSAGDPGAFHTHPSATTAARKVLTVRTAAITTRFPQRVRTTPARPAGTER